MNKNSINQNFKTNVCPDFFPCADGSYTTRIARGACSRHGGLLSVNAKPKKARQPKQIIPTPVVPNIPESIEIEIPEQVEIWPTQDQEQYLENDNYTISDFTHSKTGESFKNVILKIRVDADTFNALRALAKDFNGYWSGFAKGFLFKSLQDAILFFNSPIPTSSDDGSATAPRKTEKGSSKTKKVKTSKPAFRTGKPFELPKLFGEDLREAIEMGKNAMQLIDNEDTYSSKAALLDNPIFYTNILYYLKSLNEKRVVKNTNDNFYHYGEFSGLDDNYKNRRLISKYLSKFLKQLYPDARFSISVDYNGVSVTMVIDKTLNGALDSDEIKKKCENEIERFVSWSKDYWSDYPYRGMFHNTVRIEYKDIATPKADRLKIPKYIWEFRTKYKKWILSKPHIYDNKYHAYRVAFSKAKGEDRAKAEQRIAQTLVDAGIDISNAEILYNSQFFVYKDNLLPGDISEKEFYLSIGQKDDADKINGMEIKSNRMGLTEFALYSDGVGKVIAGAVLAFLTYKAIKK